MRVGSWSQVQSEVHQSPAIRQKVLKRLESKMKTKIVSFFVSFTHPEAIITDEDAEAFESMLSVEHASGPLTVVLNAPGGMALAAERIVNVCRAYSGEQFEVVVPHSAKSAATMICFGARKIHMSMTAELGPVDPQVAYLDDRGRPRWISAEEYCRAYDSLLKEASSGKAKRIEPFLQQLQRFDAREIESLRSAQELSRDISVKLLKTGMMSAVKETDISKSIQVFLSQKSTSSHGRMITFPRAKECGLALELIDLHSPLWEDLWELYVRSDWYVSSKCFKLIESSLSSLRQGGEG
jgi:ClpP class serine protease